MRSDTLNDYRLFPENYGTLNTSRSHGSKAFTVPYIPCRNALPFHNDNTLANNSDVEDMTVAFSAAVLCSTRRVAAAVTIVAALVAAAAETEAGAVSTPATVAAETDLAALCLVRYVHPRDVPHFPFLYGPHRLVHFFPCSCHRPKGLQEELGYLRLPA